MLAAQIGECELGRLGAIDDGTRESREIGYWISVLQGRERVQRLAMLQLPAQITFPSQRLHKRLVDACRECGWNQPASAATGLHHRGNAQRSGRSCLWKVGPAGLHGGRQLKIGRKIGSLTFVQETFCRAMSRACLGSWSACDHARSRLCRRYWSKPAGERKSRSIGSPSCIRFPLAAPTPGRAAPRRR